MNHFNLSIIKSNIRILSCIATFLDGNVIWLAAGFAIAEVLGIMEEYYDDRV
jgi:hypothetical protein